MESDICLARGKLSIPARTDEEIYLRMVICFGILEFLVHVAFVNNPIL